MVVIDPVPNPIDTLSTLIEGWNAIDSRFKAKEDREINQYSNKGSF